MSASAPAARAPTPEPGRAASRAVMGFVVRFVAGWAIALGLVAWLPGLDRWAVGNTVSSLGLVARLFRLPFAASGTTVDVAQVGMQIVPDCTPLMPTAALAIAVLAFPSSWRWRLLGLAAGALVLWVYNLVRIYALVPVLRYRPEWFEFIHVYLWQTTTLLVVFALFMVWLGAQQRPARIPEAGPAGNPGAAPPSPGVAGEGAPAGSSPS